MNNTQILLLIGALTVLSPSTHAVSVFQCEDARGNMSFQDHCPPGTKQVNQKDYKSGPASSVAPHSGTSSLTLYTIPDCDTCEQLKEFLSVRNIPIAEKNVADDINLQNELKEAAGELQVPVLVIGDKILTGYNRSSLIQALTESGYIAPGTE